MTSPTYPAVPPPYSPAPYLMASPISFLTREQLIQYFQGFLVPVALCWVKFTKASLDFYTSLEYANSAPHLVFERLISNLSVPVRAAIDEARCVGARTTPADETSPKGVPAPAYSPTALVDEHSSLDSGIALTDMPSNVFPATNHVIRSFRTADGIWDDDPRAICTKDFYTAGTPYTNRIALALTTVHTFANSDAIASAACTTPHSAGYSVTLSSLSDSFQSDLESASCSLLELDASDTDLQCGKWSLRQSHLWCSPQRSTTSDITFPVAYDQPPQVLVWIKHLFLEGNWEPSLRLLVSNITATGFTLHVNSLVKDTLCGTEITWVSCSTGRPDVHFGRFQVEDGFLDVPKAEGKVSFPIGYFKSTPRVILGLTGLYTYKAFDISIALRLGVVTREGMEWLVHVADPTSTEYVECSFIVLA